jgi:hypothetical protein
VWVSNGINVRERNMLPELEGSRFLRNDGTHLPCRIASRFRNHYLDTAMRTADVTWLDTSCVDIGRPVLSLDLVLMQKWGVRGSAVGLGTVLEAGRSPRAPLLRNAVQDD